MLITLSHTHTQFGPFVTMTRIIFNDLKVIRRCTVGGANDFPPLHLHQVDKSVGKTVKRRRLKQERGPGVPLLG